MPLVDVLSAFSEFSKLADVLVAHNIKFDRPVITAELARCGKLNGQFNKQQYCTMLNATGVCKIVGPKGFKWPKLSEAIKFFFGEDLVNAHDALTDVIACKRVYFKLMV